MIMAYGNYAPFYRGGYFNPMQTQIPNMADTQNQWQLQNMQQPLQQPMQTNSAPMQIPAQPTNDTLLWVLNENEASSYPVAPNNSVVLWDKNQKTFYIKTANAQGIPSMQVYDFTERIDNTQETPLNAPKTHKCTCGDKFVTKDQFEALQGKIEALESKFEESAVVQVTKPNKSKKGDAE
jgi:hypothetical protein